MLPCRSNSSKMPMKSHLSAFLGLAFLLACGAFAQQAATPAAAAPSAPKNPQVMVLPPEAFTTPSNHLALVNLNGAVDPTWLEKQCQYMRSQLRVSVVARPATATSEELRDLRTLAARLRAEDKDAPLQLILAKGDSLPAILAEPYGAWGFMDAGWVEKGGGDEALVLDRMGKRIFQTLGFVIGAGNRMEREAVMRYTPTPAALDDCLSHGFHPLNSGVFMVYANGIGLEPIRLRPRSELIKMGILKPRKSAPAAPAAE